jgi:hypothetical protein
MKIVAFRLLAVLLSMVVLALLGEIALRCLEAMPSRFQPIILDDTLGWRATPNINYTGTTKDISGKRLPLQIHSDAEGFRSFGDPAVAGKRKVFFLGDSFTQAVQVSDNQTYYAILRDRLPIEVFAYGAGGYGTLQESMILDRYIDRIKPDVVVLQFCFNDFFNNSYSLERMNRLNNNGMRRPYLTPDGRIVYKLPKSWARLRSFANRHSRLLYYIFKRIDRVGLSASVGHAIFGDGMSVPEFRESVEVTERILGRIKARIPAGTRVCLFSVDDGKPYHAQIKRLCDQEGIVFIEGIAQAIRQAESDGVVTRAADGGHWSPEGHKIAAGIIGKYLGEK